jgi:DNA-directed RNA polymerase subunit M/transcription elongation factor TFIIS
MYSNRCGIICNLLSPTSNSCVVYGNELLAGIIDESIVPEHIGSKTEKELCSKSIQKEKDEILLRSEQRVIEKETDLFRCPKCFKSRVSYKEVQLRAIDEAADFICKCVECGHIFRGGH